MTAASGITPQLLRTHLTRLGYVMLEAEGRAGETWVDPTNADNPAVLVPREEQHDLRGFEETVTLAVERLGWITGRSPAQVIADVAMIGDEFELRIEDSATTFGRVPVLRAPDLVEGFLQVLRAGARAEFRGTRPAYLGSDPSDVNVALEGIDLLAPAAGSFRLIAISSRQAQLAIVNDDATPDKSRRAVAATMKALSAAAELTRVEPPEDPDDLLGAVDQGVSTTLLAGLESIARGATAPRVRFAARWDPALPPVDEPVVEVAMQVPQLDRLPAYLELLRHHEPAENERIHGWIKTVSADDLHPEGQPTGFVVVEVRREGRNRDVRVELPHEHFKVSRAGASLLTATGLLERISGRWHLTAPRDIHIQDTAA